MVLSKCNMQEKINFRNYSKPKFRFGTEDTGKREVCKMNSAVELFVLTGNIV